MISWRRRSSKTNRKRISQVDDDLSIFHYSLHATLACCLFFSVASSPLQEPFQEAKGALWDNNLRTKLVSQLRKVAQNSSRLPTADTQAHFCPSLLVTLALLSLKFAAPLCQTPAQSQLLIQTGAPFVRTPLASFGIVGQSQLCPKNQWPPIKRRPSFGATKRRFLDNWPLWAPLGRPKLSSQQQTIGFSQPFVD